MRHCCNVPDLYYGDGINDDYEEEAGASTLLRVQPQGCLSLGGNLPTPQDVQSLVEPHSKNIALESDAGVQSFT